MRALLQRNDDDLGDFSRMPVEFGGMNDGRKRYLNRRRLQPVCVAAGHFGDESSDDDDERGGSFIPEPRSFSQVFGTSACGEDLQLRAQLANQRREITKLKEQISKLRKKK